jgi:hypothetical protein
MLSHSDPKYEVLAYFNTIKVTKTLSKIILNKPQLQIKERIYNTKNRPTANLADTLHLYFLEPLSIKFH